MTELFRHILVPLDFTAKNGSAVDIALELARTHGSRVTLLHVIEQIEYADDQAMDSFYESLRKQAKSKLAPLIGPFIDAGVPIKEAVTLGKRGPDIVSFAQSEDVDLVVVSSHRVDIGDGPRSWATLSYQIAVLCPCPVLLVK
jgi:nucleotide-binding universal stress UspA family protein